MWILKFQTDLSNARSLTSLYSWFWRPVRKKLCQKYSKNGDQLCFPVLFWFFPDRYYLNTIMEAENGTRYQAMVRKNYSWLWFQQIVFSVNEKEQIQWINSRPWYSWLEYYFRQSTSYDERLLFFVQKLGSMVPRGWQKLFIRGFRFRVDWWQSLHGFTYFSRIRDYLNLTAQRFV